FFAGSWTCVGREGDLEGTGAQRAGRVGGGGGLLGRGGGGGARAVPTPRPPRGPRGLGRAQAPPPRTVVCPYHAWTYDLDGALRVAPGFRDHQHFSPAEHGLVELPLESWHGFLFVNGS